jgi:Domain of unknown function (DUF5916)/Carbohydrate family 9 binding domain-like
MKISLSLTIFFLFIVAANAQSSIKITQTDSPPKIDGVLTESEWNVATKTELAYQKEPQENDKPTEKTEVYLAFDKENLYVAFHAFDSTPSGIRSPISKRDSIGNDDSVSIWLDTYDDRRRAYVFRFNPLGIQEDGIFTQADVGNLSWDGILESKGNLTTDGFIVEAIIPFKTLRYQINDKRTWGLHLFRYIARKQERSTWAKTSLANADLFSQMGSLEGIDDIFSGRTLDIIPTVTLSNNGERELQNGVPVLNKINRVDAGLTVNYSITPNLTLSATVNPDFSQVENDVPQVSINQRFPLFFPERRPFFLEGSEVFRGVFDSAPRIIDTRQIVDPDWGIKLNGKIGKNSIGFLSASDNSAGFRVSLGDANFGKNAQFNIVRYSRDILKNSNIGGSFTDRRFSGSANTVGTIDGRFQIDKSNLVAIQVSYSKTKDLDGRRRDGGAIYAVYNFENLKWDFGSSYTNINKNFVAQSGFIRRTGLNRYYSYVGRTIRPKEKTWWVKVRPFVVNSGTLNLQNNLDEFFFDPGFDLEFAKGISLYTYYSTRRDNFLGRGYSTQALLANVDVNSFKRFSLSNDFEIGTGVNFNPARPEIGKILNNELNFTIRPTSKINSEFLWLKSSLKSRVNGDKLFSQNIFRNKTTYQFNRFNSVRSIIDYDTSERRFGLSFLYAFTPSPNKSIFIGYNDLLFNGIEPLDGTRQRGLFRQSRGLFAKFSYNFRF